MREAVGRDRDVVEEALDAEPALHYVERIARTKAQVGWQRMQNRKLAERPVLGADTEVVLDGESSASRATPTTRSGCCKRLSGRTHQVLTAVAIRFRDVTEVDLSMSQVTLRRLAAAEIERYVATRRAARQGRRLRDPGTRRRVHRPHRRQLSGIVGLPLCETATLLARIGCPVL